MKRILIGTMAASALFALAAPIASAQEGDSPRAFCAMPGMVGSGDEDFFPKVGGCVSTVATGGFESGVISQAGYNQRCKALEGLFGGYPMVFEHGPRIDIANNKQECVDVLTFFHSGGLGEG